MGRGYTSNEQGPPPLLDGGPSLHETDNGIVLARAEDGDDAAKAQFVTIFDGRGRLRRELLPVDERAVGAVLIFKQILVAVDENLGVNARDAAFFAVVRCHVYIRVDIAHRVFAPDQRFALARQIEDGVVGLNDEPG